LVELKKLQQIPGKLLAPRVLHVQSDRLRAIFLQDFRRTSRVVLAIQLVGAEDLADYNSKTRFLPTGKQAPTSARFERRNPDRFNRSYFLGFSFLALDLSCELPYVLNFPRQVKAN
jgi:hypothetical protein